MRSQMKWQFLTGAMCSLTLVGMVLPCRAEESLNFITTLSGDVKVKRPNRSNYQKTQKNETLSSKDLLQLGTQASATVLCGNLRRWKVPQGKISRVADGCPPGVATLKNPNSTRTPVRTGNDPTIPYVISPRLTTILDHALVIKWHPVVGVTSYTVEINGVGVNWSQKVSKLQTTYSGTPLKAGYYQVFVTGDNGASSRSEVPVGFTIASDVEVKRIRADVDRLQREPLEQEAKTLALAYLYRGNQLNAAAIAVLEEFIQRGNPSASVYQLLGEIYQQIGLLELAREQFLVALAKIGDNVEGKASIQASLGAIDTVLGRVDEAKQWYRQAQVGYRDLGDKEQVKELQKKLDELAGT